MALSDDDIIQTNEGFVVASTSVVASLAATTAGNSVIVFIGTGLAGITGLPAGFEAVGSTGSTGIPICFYKSDVGAGETSWTFTGASADHAWIALEVSNLELVEPADVVTLSGSTSRTNGQTLAAPAGQSASLSTMQLAVWNAALSSGTATKSWGSYTDDFVEVAQVEATSGTNRHALAVTRTFSVGSSTASYTSTATLTISTGAATCRGRMYIFREKDSPMSASLDFLTGFSQATHGGLAGLGPDGLGTQNLNDNSSVTFVGTWGTHYSIDPTAGLDGTPALRINVSAATCNVPVARTLSTPATYGLRVKVASGSGTPTLFTWDTSATDLLLLYDVANEKLGLQWAGGSVSWQTGTTPLDTLVWVEVRHKINATTHRADWWCETGDGDGLQTSPANLTGQVSSTYVKSAFGALGSQTVDFYADSYLLSRYYGAFPLGPHQVKLAVPEITGATVSGTSANFNKFTANGTLAAFASDAGALLDEVPVTVSASADGLAQVTTAASDYVELPMADLTLGSDDIIAGVRVIAALWGGTGSGTGTFGIYGWNGTAETPLLANTVVYDAASPTAISATEPMWFAELWPGPWTVAQLNAACVRVGKSTDATPDMGVSAVYLEVALRQTAAPSVLHRLTSDEDPEAVAATVTERLHPYTSGVRTYTVSNDDATRTAEFRFYETGGGEHADSPVTVAPLDPPVDVTVGAEVFGEIESTTFGWL